MNSKINNRGFTLVELLVTFVLLGLFMTAAVALTGFIAETYFEVKSDSYGQQVSEIVLDRICQELEGGEIQAGASPIISDAVAGGSNNITLYDRTGTKVMIFKDGSDRLAIRYFEVTSGENTFDTTDWRFDEKTYMGFALKKITFSWANGSTANTPEADYDFSPAYAPNIIKVNLELESPRYGKYNAERYIEMYNYEKP